MEYIKEKGTIKDLPGVIAFEEFESLVKLDKIRDLESRYLTEEEIALRYQGREGLERAKKELH